MELIVNAVLVIALSLFPSQHEQSAKQAGVYRFTGDAELRGLLVSGKLEAFHQRVEERIAEQLHDDLRAAGAKKKGLSPESLLKIIRSPERTELSGFLSLIQTAMEIGSFVMELQTLGPVKAMRTAVSWVDKGLIRKAGVRPNDFPSYFQIVSDPDRPKLNEGDLDALEQDSARAQKATESAYSKILTRLAETIH